VSAPAGPTIVAWDTSTDEGVVAVGEGPALLAETRFRTVRGHTGWLMPLVASTVSSAGLAPSDVDAVAAGTGPGGFTGVKVAVATAKGLALALVGVPTLDLLAAHARLERGTLLASMDARQGRLYVAGYRASVPVPERCTDYECLTPEEAASFVAEVLEGEASVTGFVPETLLEAAGGACARLEVIDIPAPGFPSGEILISLAAEMFDRRIAGDACSVMPLYLKKPV
jgi:tRNA threonylcarbamoyladenosine biosynthesis protein TsaB